MMEHMKPYLLLLAFLTASLPACNSGKKALERGDYESAVLAAVDRLRKSPNNSKARETLAEAYPRFVDYNKDQIRRALKSSTPLRWDDVVEFYRQLNEVYDEIRRSPAAMQVIGDPQLFTAEYERALSEAAEVHYRLGTDRLSAARQGDREAAKDAFWHFDRADEYQPGLRDATRLAEEARALAVMYVVVEPIPLPSRVLEVSSTFFYNQLLTYLKQERPSPFVRFLSVDEARANGIRPDQEVQLVFDDYVVGQAYVRETIRERSRDSVIVGQTTVVEDGKEVSKDVYGTVKAEMHQFQKQIDSRGLLDCRIVAPTDGAVLAQEKFPGSFTWLDYWGYYRGDERALIQEDRRYLAKSREVPPPPPQDLFVEFTKPIFQELTRFLGAFYRNY